MRPDPYAWSLHPAATLGVLLLVLLYALALRRFPAPRWRIGAFALGALLLLATAVTPLEPLTFHLVTAHLLQNVVLAEWAPLLIVLGVPPALASTLAARVPGLRPLTRPAVALPLWLATYFLWHLPPAYDAALEHPGTLLHLEHVSYFLAGLLLWWPVLQHAPWRLGDGARSGYVFAAFVLGSPLGLLLALLPSPIYDFYAGGEELWGLARLADQQIAGVTMASEEAVVFFAVFFFLFARFLRDEERLELEGVPAHAPFEPTAATVATLGDGLRPTGRTPPAEPASLPPMSGRRVDGGAGRSPP
ncbi:MAG: cytochrome c oxidase assembly protein [Actinobacteria bacterium]|nr:cytochrome c oxidase assembly protein [Actinomycetota bacterium]